MRKYLILLVAVLAMFAALPSAQQQSSTEPQAPDASQPSVTFRVEVNYVEVDASVFDREGRFVGDLKKEDFEVREDGIVQDVTAFSLVNIPIERAERPLFVNRPIEPDVSTNARPFDGRLYVVVLDDIHTAPFRTAQVRRAAREFIEQYMADNDMAAIVYTGGRVTAGQDFTSSKPLLLAAIDRFTGRKIRSTTLERLDDYQRQRQIPMSDQISRLNDALEPERGRDALTTLDVLHSISEWIGGIRGRRKAILFLSEGIDYDLYDFNKRDARHHRHRCTVERQHLCRRSARSHGDG
jgi:VWFA-related protein